MAVDKLSLYNDALLLLGQRALSSVSEDREPRHRLDDIYAIEALEFCFEAAQPLFARETNTLASSSTSSNHGLDNVHTLPNDYISLVGVWSDDKLDQPLNRYIIENKTLACEFSTIYVRFMSNTFVTTFTNWTPAFARVVSAYLAREMAERFAPDKYAEIDGKFQERVEKVLQLNAAKEPSKRPTATAFTLTADYLAVYNDALVMMGLDEIATINDDSERRTKLDRVMVNGAEDYCLEVIKPVFAKTTSKLTTSVVSTQHDLDNVFTLPTGYICPVGVFSDAKLDQEINRYIIEADTIACEYSTIYVRHVSNTSYTTSQWSPSFRRALAAFIAREASLSLKPEAFESLDKRVQERFGAAQESELAKEPQQRSSATTVTLTNPWRVIYNDALLIMGLNEITTNDDDSDRRVKLDRALDAGLVESVLEDTGWSFGRTSTHSQFDPSLEPEFGFQRVHAVPSDMVVLHGIYQDEYMEVPLKRYKDEGDFFFCDLDDLYIEYVSTEFLTNPANWPTYFRRLIAGRLAKDACNSLPGADKDNAKAEYKDRNYSAMSTDAMGSPPRRLSRGNWTQARHRGGYRNRPGGW